MGKHNKGKSGQAPGYKPSFVMHKKPQIGEPVKRQKIGDNKDKIVQPLTAKQTKILGGLEVISIDASNGTFESLEQFKQLNRDAIRFDFNAKDDFTPDNDSIKVATKFWQWLLNPIPFESFIAEQFGKGKCLAIIRTSGETEEKGSDSDSYGSEDEENPKYTYDQMDSMDNLVDHKMIKEFLSSGLDPQGSPLEFGKHIDVVKYINQREFNFNQKAFDKDYVIDALEN